MINLGGAAFGEWKSELDLVAKSKARILFIRLAS